jgi:hypothetical protein
LGFPPEFLTRQRIRHFFKIIRLKKMRIDCIFEKYNILTDPVASRKPPEND